MKLRLLSIMAVAAATLVTVATALAQAPPTSPTDPLPPLISSGFDALKSKGPEDALKAWIKGSPVDGSKEALSQAAFLLQVESLYGDYVSFDVIRSKRISPRCSTFYIVINFDKGPVFSRFVLYKSHQDWILTYFNFNTKPDVILPADDL
jgi:hypothetical protein